MRRKISGERERARELFMGKFSASSSKFVMDFVFHFSPLLCGGVFVDKE
jgi:hypothetical protein